MALKLSVIGTGYLGATHAACMASLGFEVIGFDTEVSKIELLSKGKVPFYEPDLEELLAEQIKAGRLRFTKDIAWRFKTGMRPGGIGLRIGHQNRDQAQA